jgi:hypothetical protein
VKNAGLIEAGNARPNGQALGRADRERRAPPTFQALTLLFGAGNAGVHTLEDALTFELREDRNCTSFVVVS